MYDAAQEVLPRAEKMLVLSKTVSCDFMRNNLVCVCPCVGVGISRVVAKK
jgi:hypothetical protein